MNKKMKLLFISLVIIILTISSGCGQKENAQGNDTNANNEEGKVSGIVPFYTPGSGGTIYILGAGLSKIFNETDAYPSAQLAVEASTGTLNALDLLIEKYNAGKPAFAAGGAADMIQVHDGNHPDFEGKHEELKAIGSLGYGGVHVVVSEKSSIETFYDLKGKRVGASPGSAPELILKRVLEAGYGLSEDDYELLPFGYAEVQQGIQNGSLDAGILMGAIPAPLVKEMASLEDIRILSVGEKELEKFLNEYPFYSSRTVEAGTYEGQDSELTIPVIENLLMTHEKTDEEFVYQVLKTLLENQEQLVDIHPIAKYVTPETIMDGVKVPLHKGAEKYLKEQGIIK